MKRTRGFLHLLLALALVLTLIPATVGTARAETVIDSGECGYDLGWSLWDDGSLQITGSGEMYDYDSADEVPWCDYRDEITFVYLGWNIESIGDYAFYGCSNLTEVRKDNCDDEIAVGKYAFKGCSSLKTFECLTYGYCEMDQIGDYAFDGCSSLKKVEICADEVGAHAFSGCTGLTSVKLHGDDISIGSRAFQNDSALTSLRIDGTAPELSSTAFYGLTAKVLYCPVGDRWAQVAGKNYGGTITWSCDNKCGASATWAINDDGMLTISGTGAMTNYNPYIGESGGDYGESVGHPKLASYSYPGYYGYRGRIENATVSDGITAIGSGAFFDLCDMESINIPASVTKIGRAAFYPRIDEWEEDDYYYSLNDVYYGGSMSQWNAISIGDYNAYLFEATLHTSTPPLSITTQPKNITAKVGETALFKVVAEGDGLTYRWQYNSGSGWKNSGLTGHATANLKVPVTAARHGQQYRCVIVDSGGDKVISKAVTLSAKAYVTTQPKNITAKVGDTALFKVAAVGNGLTYRWQYNSGSGWKNSGLTGHDTPNLKVPVTAARNGQQYRCVVEDQYGNKSISTAGTLTVKLVLTGQPQPKTAKAGATVKFTVKATGAGLAYKWQYRTPDGSWKNSGAAGCKTATLTVTPTAGMNGYQYRCVVTDANGAKVISDAVTLTVI